MIEQFAHNIVFELYAKTNCENNMNASIRRVDACGVFMLLIMMMGKLK